MSDLVERLLSSHSDKSGDDYFKTIYAERKEAAAEIKRLLKLVEHYNQGRKNALRKMECEIDEACRALKEAWRKADDLERLLK